MRRVLVILLLVVGITLLDRVVVAEPIANIECSISDLHREQLCCNHRYNFDAENPSSIVVPTARTSTNLTTRNSQQCVSAISIVGHHYASTKYLVARCINRLGHFSRAIDFYLYVFCVLRL